VNAYQALLAEARGRPFAAIVGWPVEHSRSPALHGYWLRKYGIEGHYGRLPVEPKPEALKALVDFLKTTANACGCNLTLPHKIDIMPLLDRIHPDAERIGAVNTVVKQPDGSLEGRNSDAFGFLAALRQGAPAWQAAAGPVVVLGAGGAARASWGNAAWRALSGTANAPAARPAAKPVSARKNPPRWGPAKVFSVRSIDLGITS